MKNTSQRTRSWLFSLLGAALLLCSSASFAAVPVAAQEPPSIALYTPEYHPLPFSRVSLVYPVSGFFPETGAHLLDFARQEALRLGANGIYMETTEEGVVIHAIRIMDNVRPLASTPRPSAPVSEEVAEVAEEAEEEIGTPISAAAPSPDALGNSILKSFDAFAWGSSLDAALAHWGEPTRREEAGDTVLLTYRRHNWQGRSVEMNAIFLPQGGLQGGGYAFQQSPGSCIETANNVAETLLDIHPGIRLAGEERLRFTTETESSTEAASGCPLFDAGGRVSLVRHYADPTGTAVISLLHQGSASATQTLILYRAREEPTELTIEP